jgi:hypothetical protein
MGVSPFFCCFEDKQPKCLTSTGIASSILAFAFFIWGITDLEFKRNWIKALYIITFIIVIILIVAFIALFILVSLPKSKNYMKIMNSGRLISLGVLILTGIAFIFLLLSFIFLLVDYGKLQSELNDIKNGVDLDDDDIDIDFDDDDIDIDFDDDDIDIDFDDLDFGIDDDDFDDDYDWALNLDNFDTEFKIVGHEWGAVIAPSVIGLIVLVINGLVTNYLYRVFTDNLYSTPEYQATNNSNQNTVGVVTPNMNQPELLQNNNGPVPPIGNNINNPVEIKQN